MKQRNDLFMALLGYTAVTVNHYAGEDETDWQRQNEQWLDKVEIHEVGDYYVDVANDRYVPANEVNFEKDWNQIMRVAEVLFSKHSVTLSSNGSSALVVINGLDHQNKFFDLKDHTSRQGLFCAALEWAMQFINVEQEVAV